eukprot:sb/3464904/
MDKLWDGRVRAYLGERYDAGRNVSDMDFSLKLKERAALLDFKEYASWRETGRSYDVRDGVFDTPNRTLSSGVIRMIEGQKRFARGYWGDIVCSPYLSHGIFSPLKSLYEIRNRINVRTASEVAEYNIMSLIHHITTGQKYTEPPKPDRFTFEAASKKEKEGKGSATLEEIKEEEEEGGEAAPVIDMDITKLNLIAPACGNVKIKLLPLGTVDQMQKKSCYQSSFDLIYLSSSQVSYLTPGLTTLLKDDANLLVENIKFIAPLSKEQEAAYLPKIKEMGVAAKSYLSNQNSNTFLSSFVRLRIGLPFDSQFRSRWIQRQEEEWIHQDKNGSPVLKRIPITGFFAGNRLCPLFRFSCNMSNHEFYDAKGDNRTVEIKLKEDWLTCGVCEHVFDFGKYAPHQLPCGDTCCLSCLRDFAGKNGKAEEMFCPEQ